MNNHDIFVKKVIKNTDACDIADLRKTVENITETMQNLAVIQEIYRGALEERVAKSTKLGIPFTPVCGRGFWIITDTGLVDVKCPETENDLPIFINQLNAFSSRDSALKHKEMMLEWRKSLKDNNAGEPIDISVLLPLLKQGWVAMDADKGWFWFSEKPEIVNDDWGLSTGSVFKLDCMFNLKPNASWKKSLMKCG